MSGGSTYILSVMVIFERKCFRLSIPGAALAILILTLSSCGKPERYAGDQEGLEKKNMANLSEAVKTETATFSLG
jgi:hypothetical protein